MDEEKKFWLALYRIVGWAVTLSMLGISGCTMHENYLISEMAQHGVNPIAASCSISPQMQHSEVCGIQAAK